VRHEDEDRRCMLLDGADWLDTSFMARVDSQILRFSDIELPLQVDSPRLDGLFDHQMLHS
jgi:hypothetical protein